jgi:hypothetical protein
MQEMLVPMPWHGTVDKIIDHEVQWLKNLPANTYCALWQQWPEKDLPSGYDLYVVSFHLEAVSVKWIKRQCQLISAPIILLSDSNYYNWPKPSNLKTHTWYYWHHQLDKILKWYPHLLGKQIKYKSSAICNRITQSKLLVITKLLENPNSQSLIKLSTWLDDKNLHFNEKTGRVKIDSVTEIFKNKYLGLELKIDDFDNRQNNFQKHTSNPNENYLQQAAIHWTNESFHYSYYHTDDECYIHPGPFLTEKTLKCLISETAFIPVGQFDIYGTLSKLGLKFDYGSIDLTWDKNSANLDRLENIIDLVDTICEMNCDEIFNHTVDSTRYNREYIISGQFAKNCVLVNQHTEKTILDTFAV